MQQQRFIRQLFVAALISGGTMLMSACDDSDALPIQADEVRYSDTLIQPTATVVTPVITKGDFEGPINGTTFTPSSEKIFGVSAFVGGDNIPQDWTPNSRINFSPVHSDAEGKYYFDESKYYPIDSMLYFYAFSPMVHCTMQAGTSTAHPTVTYTITGREDIVWSKNESGIAKAEDPLSQQHPDFQFNHLLQRVIFSVKRTANVSPTLQLTQIRITGLRNNATLDLIKGELSFEGDPTNSISINYSYTPTTEFEIIPYDLMFEPGVTTFNMVAVIDGVEYPATVDLNPTENEHAGKAGYKHIVQLTINGSTLSVGTPQITDWESFTTTGNI